MSSNRRSQGFLAHGVSSLVGLGAEAYQHRKDKSKHDQQAADPQPERAGSSLSHPDKEDAASSSDSESDEEDWAKDDLAQGIETDKATPSSSMKDVKAADFVATFLQRHPAPVGLPTSSLTAPVIIPQRRPSDRRRGFVRAYAPALAECGVEQEAFLEFLDGFEAVIEGNGWFTVVDVGVTLASIAETVVAFDPVTHAVAYVVHVALDASRRGYMSKK